ncbi:Adenosine monophosphate-protein transferase FICD [Colletotrichum sp. SAR 10_70]|nr:Adenosine monophosphate-protein transferase FICD [Colletotrichum sp. SAR 10_71]KAI8182451.1 Adenosine monophosphate-protein transferase FICD [Colletotrichum sp. SAR 10_75]KAI8194107.1 Adenosine monophosphate-protein transferase FICD [Colletotrichum sp. SAR 10_70]KAI8221003.1 Adenosine monophosphate-protein transferase FICD [Colletotrichum sp. SAR 10_77]KAI8221580.1 Adenosine monophosphate-protein transferase FICD [Colletotrichum sp. SAR 10_86]KAJ5001070.1 Adenosine monophosphate-protein tra
MYIKTLKHMREQLARKAKLKEIYAPFANLQKGSEEYERLANSGRVWEDYFQPSDSRRLGYVDLQQDFNGLLERIDDLRGRLPLLELARKLVPRYAQQSVMIEHNPLQVVDAVRIFEQLKFGQRFGPVGMLSMPSSKLPDLAEPDGCSATAELRNHIIASQWIADNATAKLHTSGITETEMRDLAALSIKGTASEATAYGMAWGGPVPLGAYRTLPVAVRSSPLVVFPYPQEVPACVRRFFAWRDVQHAAGLLHPLVLACQMTAYFVSVHPLPDGNGRVSRMVMQDYMARQGYLPAILRPEGALEREEYIRMIRGACEGRPREFVAAVVEAQLALVEGHLRRKSGDGDA